KNKTLDRIFKKIRARTGVVLLSAQEMRTSIKTYLDQQYLLALVADQNPGDTRNHYWGSFFGKPTPFVKGPETGARANHAAVVFCQITKMNRGYYEVHFELASSDAADLPEKELTRRYILYLERVITAHPEMWLWSHRRWKHKWKPEYKEQWVDNAPLPV
ncbi:MAG: lysophospholipid acyltransferase family protein, partial [Flavisolibacter sp.]